MISTKIQIFLILMYGVLSITTAVEGSWAKALYWVGAIILTTGVLLMK